MSINVAQKGELYMKGFLSNKKRKFRILDVGLRTDGNGHI